jgi:hypothetical protein
VGTINNLAKRFAALNYEVVKQQALIETAPQVIPEMTEQQMRRGETSTGEPIKPDLADVHYALLKQEAGGQAPYKTPDLRNSGSFQSGLRTLVTATALKTYSLDTKSEKLELKYTPKIYGANPENLSKYAKENLLPDLMGKIKAATVG